ncbi:3-keto-5-aminohexanoate cleavage protein [Boseongicola sp. H5]|uniref:3-keto-5-aminohexanoate cleavage protein n=1 Tax=Boseongicola sp. H5 TaxID=2763261 RepID=UPI001D09A4DA|nr:3-keto-5-aminohexanoate cleavage protein [Boseongicola sp. H5]
MAPKKTIITCAVTGAIHTPSMSPHLPITPDQITASAIEAAEAGAAVLHMHVRDPETGEPKQDPALFAQVLPRVRQGCDAIINITTGGGLGMTVEERIAPATAFAPELASLNMGSFNFATFPLAERPTEWRHDWEQPYLARTRKAIYPNTFDMLEDIIGKLGKAAGTRFEFECYDLGHLANLNWCVREGLVEPPFLVQGIFGIMGGMAATPQNLMQVHAEARRLFGDEMEFSCFAVGRQQMPFLAMSTILGGHVRVGLEDSLYISRGVLSVSNAEQVAKIRRIIEELGGEIATPEEAREILALKGADRTGIPAS